MEAIGDFARATGLTQRALRLYDSLGLLRPAVVDPATGYRWYGPGQRRVAVAIAALRGIGMPLAAIGAVLAAEPDEAHELVDRHWSGVEASVTAGRAAVASIHALIDEEETPMTTTIPNLRAGLGRVLFAAGRDPERQALQSVLVRTGPDGVRLVATDSYRLVELLIEGSGPAGEVVLHRDALGELAAALDDAAEITLRLVEGSAVFEDGVEEHRLPAQPVDFPDYESLMPTSATHRVEVDAPDLLAALEPLLDAEAVAAAFVGDGLVVGTTAAEGAGLVVWIDPRYLRDGVAAAPGDGLTVAASDPLAPMEVAAAGDGGYRYLLMPVRRA